MNVASVSTAIPTVAARPPLDVTGLHERISIKV